MESTSNFPSVVFLDILDQYSLNTNLTCNFCFNRESRGSVAIFKLGWSHVTEYVAIKSVPEISKDRTTENISSVTFNRHVLPKNTSDLYQICYISGNDLHGASTPFQFCAEDNLMASANSFQSKVLSLGDSMASFQFVTERDQEISRLRTENAVLKEVLKTLLDNKTEITSKDYDQNITEIRDLVEGLKLMLIVHDTDIKMLKNKITEGGEEYKKLYLEKLKIQKKYEKYKSTYYVDKKSLHGDGQPINDFNLDLEDLNSMPPFPSILKM